MEKSMLLVTRSGLLIWLLLGCCTSLSHAFEVQLQQAQEQLSRLGYDPGVADGVYGPRTRQALEAFQGTQGLPVTGILDEATRQALERDTAISAVASSPSGDLPRSPLHVVLEYLRFHESQPARSLQYVTEHFLNGMDPQQWIEQTMQARLTQARAYVAWKVQGVEIAEMQATVRVHARIRVHEQEHSRAEVFTLLSTLDGDWLIDAWRLEPLPQEEQSPQSRTSTRGGRTRP
jgi:hypothetical protein